jgi:deoxyribodipyrimidine photo-lyase
MSSPNHSLRGLIGFHRDLRVQDHEAVATALKEGGRWGAFFIEASESGESSEIQIRFQKECREVLKHRLASLGIEVNEVPPGGLSEWLERATTEHPNARLLRSRCYNSRDEALISMLTAGWDPARIRVFDQGTLFLQQDLPFELKDLPPTFTPFYRRLKKEQSPIRRPLPLIHLPEESACREWVSARGFAFQGGELAAHARMRAYFSESRALGHYRETRNGMLEWNDSSKLSPYLSMGCITARQVNEAIGRYEERWGATESTEALRYELVWRDYFKFLSLRFGERIFSERGVRDREVESVRDHERFLAWTRGETGNDFIDANLRELRETGWMSNRGRQNVASFLAKIWRLPWVWGAEWFQARLLDYDPETNWGNWMYLAGVGTDPRDRVFNPDLQAQIYDPDGRYRSLWLES